MEKVIKMTELMVRINEGIQQATSNEFGIQGKNNGEIIEYSVLKFIDVEHIVVEGFTSKSLEGIVKSAKEIGNSRNHEYVVVEHRDYKNFYAKYYTHLYRDILNKLR